MARRGGGSKVAMVALRSSRIASTPSFRLTRCVECGAGIRQPVYTTKLGNWSEDPHARLLKKEEETMNPFRENDVPSVPYNKTEVQVARIREEEETKRRKAEAREKTRQVAKSHDGYWWVRVVAAASTVIVSLIGYFAYVEHIHAIYPGSVESRCVETSEIVSISDSQKRCEGGGWFETKPTDKEGQLLVRCRCDRRPEPGAAAPAANPATSR
jgi:hypothetical protein